MPAVPKSPRSKKAAGPAALKPKGAVRAKSGCYTCRIRRKKCDEKRSINGVVTCETCSRLKLECLGFGAKRPEWLRESSRIQEIRDRIKAHLAAQGMIKGHAGSGTRNVVQEDILLLSAQYPGAAHEQMMYPSGGSSSSASTPRRDESVESDHHPYGMPIMPGMHNQGMRHIYEPRYPVHSDIPSRSDSPDDTMMHSSVDYDQAEYGYTYDRPTLVPVSTPATRSTFSKFYTDIDFFDLYTMGELDEPNQYAYPPQPGDLPLVTHAHPSSLLPNEILYDSLRNYVDNVVKIQYLLGDKHVLPDMIWSAINNHYESRTAVSLLSKAYYGRQDNPGFIVLDDNEVNEGLDVLARSLNRAMQIKPTTDDAMAALHVVSLYLFDGGKGRWNTFLSFAVVFVQQYLRSQRYNSCVMALEAALPKDEFVIKTTIWFDVLASITTQRPPVLLAEIRELFGPDRQSWIEKPPSYSMMSPMGCENIVVWALAETTNLSYWKRKHEQQGTLSVSDLVHRAQDIDAHLTKAPLPELPSPTPEDWARRRTAEIFRTSTRLLLKIIESGDYPLVREVQQATNDAFAAIRDISTSQYALLLSEHRSAIVRSTVFGFFICGAFSTSPDQRHALSLMLRQDCGQEGVGNCSAILDLLERLWGPETPRNKPVRWRRLLKANNVLLV